MLVLLGKYLKLKNKYDNPHILEQKFNASCKTEYKTDWLRIKLHVAVQTIFRDNQKFSQKIRSETSQKLVIQCVTKFLKNI